jgi:hypothetical protein
MGAGLFRKGDVMKPILRSLGVLAVLLLISSALAAADAANGPSVVTPDGCGVDLVQILAAQDAPVCSSKAGDLVSAAQTNPLELAVAIHCCGVGAADACRDLCRQQGPGCKGTIGCRAGECVCTCSCP